MILEKINKPNDIKQLSPIEYNQLADEIRRFLIEKISKTGGHLASNLGVVELTMALHLAFNLPQDKLIWDVGHQSYTHKILTGRKNQFDQLRKFGGMSGFPKRNESHFDAFDTGHSSTSISAGLGLVKARDLKNEHYSVVSVIGDGALTGGMAYEALNNASSLKTNFIIVLNDNTMSIAKNVGGVPHMLSNIRSSDSYYDLKENVTNTLYKLPGGDHIVERIKKTKSNLKQIILPGQMFECMGISYLGPVNGHDIEKLIKVFHVAKRINGAVIIHVVTHKGHGYKPAERNPAKFHGIGPFDIVTGKELKSSDKPTYSDVFSEKICQLAKKDKSIVAVTAAMPDGTGLNKFSKWFPDRFFDVGIAEEHAVTFSAGMAAGGLKPVFAVYSSFLQRGFDQIIHDIAIGGFSVRLLIDRAGIVGEDGETHQGLFDVSFLASVPDMTVYSPCYYSELENDIKRAAKEDRFCAVRYPRGCEKQEPDLDFSGDFTVINGGKKAIVTYGRLFSDALEAKAVCKDISIVKLNKIYPLSRELTDRLKEFNEIHFFEEGIRSGGIAELCAARLLEEGYGGIYKIHAVENRFVPTATVTGAIKACGLDTESMIAAVSEK